MPANHMREVITDLMIGERDHVVSLVSTATAVSPWDILSTSRGVQIQKARQIVFLLLHECLHWPMAKIATATGASSHATIHNGLRRLRKACAKDPLLKARVDVLARILQFPR